MSEFFVIIPAAGESRRYRDLGHPYKPVIWIRTKEGVDASMLSHVEDTAPAGVLMVALPRGVKTPQDSRGHVVSIAKTSGQADTIYQMVRRLPENARVLILDCDMILERRDIETLVRMLDIFDVTVAVTKTFDPNASRVDCVPYPMKFVEKQPISEWGIVGARAFKSAGVLSSALEETIAICDKLKIEPYLSMAMDKYVGTKYAHIIKKYMDWGTPERLKNSGAEIIS